MKIGWPRVVRVSPVIARLLQPHRLLPGGSVTGLTSEFSL